MQINDITSTATLIVSSVGVALAIWQWRKSIAIKRAKFVDSLYEKFRTDSRIRDAIYRLDYTQDWYNENFHDSDMCGDGFEASVDILLEYLSYICYLRKTGILRKVDFKLAEYVILRALSNYGLQDYFYNLYHFSCSQGVQFPFPDLLQYATRNKLFDAAFFSADSCLVKGSRFHKHLNF